MKWIQANPPPERLRPTLQLKIKANSWNEFRPTPPPPPPPERLRPTLQLKIKANSWNKGSAENLHELTWRRLFSFQLILVLHIPDWKQHNLINETLNMNLHNITVGFIYYLPYFLGICRFKFGILIFSTIVPLQNKSKHPVL